MSSLKSFKVWGTGGPNPAKVAIVLEELGLPYENISIGFHEVKNPEYVATSPNDRLLSLQDPNNNDLILWESGAIIDFLIDRYDDGRRLTFAPGTEEACLARPRLHFQIPGQGPPYGQAFWFKNFHSEQLPSAIDRFTKEVNRVAGVLDYWLAQQKQKFRDGEGPFLVENRFSHVDLVFVPWQWVILKVLKQEQFEGEDYPHLIEWYHRISGRERVMAGLKNVPPLEA